MSAKWKEKALAFWNEGIKPFAVIVIVLCSFRSAVADWNDVPTGSMKPTILEGDRIFVNKLAYDLRIPFTDWRIARWAEPHRGDVVVLFSPDDDVRMVKRVIGLPGDRIELKNNRVYINDKPGSYGPLDPAIIQQIDSDDQPRHRFYRETFEASSHPIMTTPSVSARRSVGPVIIPEGHYFVMGDNRDASRDSRWFGLVPQDRIVGEALAVVMSLDRDHYYKPRWDRFLTRLP